MHLPNAAVYATSLHMRAVLLRLFETSIKLAYLESQAGIAPTPGTIADLVRLEGDVWDHSDEHDRRFGADLAMREGVPDSFWESVASERNRLREGSATRTSASMTDAERDVILSWYYNLKNSRGVAQ